MSMPQRLSAQNVGYSIVMALACLIAYLITTTVLNSAVVKDDDVLGGMWAAVAAAFVFRESSSDGVAAGASRLAATFVSIALCFAYLWFFRASPVGIAIVLAAGTLVMFLLNRPGEVITTAITTIVVIAVAIMSPADAWTQPLLRLGRYPHRYRRGCLVQRGRSVRVSHCCRQLLGCRGQVRSGPIRRHCADGASRHRECAHGVCPRTATR